MENDNEIVITPDDLAECKVIRKKITLKNWQQKIICGTLFDCNCRPIPNAIIEVIKVEYTYENTKVSKVGYVTTNGMGEFAILIDVKNTIDYKLNIYRPILKT
ncbi:MAG: hypothetical protein AB9856_05885 [Cellulosilyticaceae bacterium]